MEEIVRNLEKLGFTVYESKVFCVLFEGHLLTASEIAQKAEIPRSSAYDILKEFVKQGICNEIQTSSVAKYEIIDPAIVQDKIEKEIHDTYQSRMTNLKDSFDKLQPIFRAKEMEAQKVDVELIKGFNKHRYAKQLQLWSSSSKELLVMAKLEGRATAEADQRTIDFIKNGGKVKTLYEASPNFKLKIGDEWKDMTTDSLVEFTIALTAEGEEVRLTENINQFMAIFDRKVVYISLVDPTISRYNRSDIIVKNENFASSMAEYFEQQWNKAYTPEDFKNRNTGEQK
ncbi:MAG TPA: helix-turn-helix domain-containing protein [Ignavibacteria bacterium]|jgi:sugar-specific transcriptional regulator TrmB